jgi:hypothetical protein
LRFWLLNCGDYLANAAFSFNFSFGGRAEGVGADGELFRKLAVAEDFNAIGAAIGQAGGTDSGLIDACAVIEAIEGFEIDGQEAGGMAGVIEAALGDASDEGHLATFKADADRATGAGSLALATAAAGFAVAAGFTLAEAFAAVLGAGTRF